MGTISICLERGKTGWILSLSSIYFIWFSIRSVCVRKSIRSSLDSSCHLRNNTGFYIRTTPIIMFSLSVATFPQGLLSLYFYGVKGTETIHESSREIYHWDASSIFFFYFTTFSLSPAIFSYSSVLLYYDSNNFQESCSILAGMIYFWFVPEGRIPLTGRTTHVMCCNKLFKFFCNSTHTPLVSKDSCERKTQRLRQAGMLLLVLMNCTSK